MIETFDIIHDHCVKSAFGNYIKITTLLLLCGQTFKLDHNLSAKLYSQVRLQSFALWAMAQNANCYPLSA